MKTFRVALLNVFIILMMLLPGCGDVELTSKWRENEILIDGSSAEWGNSLNTFEKEKVAVGLANDSENLYLCVILMDRQTQMQVVRMGLTLWFDSTGADSKIFGVHFPLGIRSMDFSRRPADQSGEERNRLSASEMLRMLHEMEILGADNKVLEKFLNLHSAGLQASINDSTGSLVYELKVPLHGNSDHPYAIGTGPGRTFSIGLETEEFKRENRPADEGTQEGRTRRGGWGGGGRRGGGGTPRSGQFQGPPEPLKVWAKVHLSIPESESHE
jgi:hypothetical protein